MFALLLTIVITWPLAIVLTALLALRWLLRSAGDGVIVVSVKRPATTPAVHKAEPVTRGRRYAPLMGAPNPVT